METISILEVSPRDGLQNEPVSLSLEDKKELVEKLINAGLSRIELGAFVSPQRSPQMRDTGELAAHIIKDREAGLIPQNIKFSALAPNEKGLTRALESGIEEIAVLLSATDSFSKKNINRSADEGYQICKKLCKQALKEGLSVRAYLSVCFDCPYEGKVLPETVVQWAKKAEDLGVYEIAISDTTGQAGAREVESLLQVLLKEIPTKKIACHFHNAGDMALANVQTAFQAGVKSFDGSVGGLGGCPYSKNPSGNIPTESLFYLLKDRQSPSIKKLFEIALWLEKKLNKKLSSPLLRSSSP